MLYNGLKQRVLGFGPGNHRLFVWQKANNNTIRVEMNRKGYV